MKIVLVDDEPLIVQGLEKLVIAQNLPSTTVTGFTDAAEALAWMRENPTDLLFLDINMPDMNGLALLEQLKPAREKLQTVILSGCQEFSYAQKAIGLGVKAYLIKPIDPAQLEKQLHLAFVQVHNLSPAEYADLEIIGPEIFNIDTGSCSASLKKALRYIEKHLLEDVSLSSLGEHTGLHPNYISSIFKKELGFNYMNYVHAMKMKHVLDMLCEYPDMPLLEVAHRLGYSSERQFYRVFKRFFGLTPGQYRERGLRL